MILLTNINCDFESTLIVIFLEGYLKLFIELDEDLLIIFIRFGRCLAIRKQFGLYIGLAETLKTEQLVGLIHVSYNNEKNT